MSTINCELITCDLCQRSYNLNVYQRHRNKNQCIKRNQHRLPFESIKQRSIQIGDEIFSVQEKSQKKNNDKQILNNYEKKPQQISNHTIKHYQEKSHRMLSNNNHRRTLEQAKQLLERRIKYQPPWIQKRSNNNTRESQSKLSRNETIILQTKDLSNNSNNQRISPKKSHSYDERPSPPTTKFKNDDIPIKSNMKNHTTYIKNKQKKFFPVSDRRNYNHIISQKPISTNSPKSRISQVTTTTATATTSTSKPGHQIDQTYSPEQHNFSSHSTRKAYTWTRSSKQTPNRDIISPIHIPTFYDSSSGQFHDRNQNYDDDEFEPYSPSPISTPKYSQDKDDTKNLLPNIHLIEQQTFIRPNTYQKSKRSNIQLPPINPTTKTNSKLKHHSIKKPVPWR